MLPPLLLLTNDIVSRQTVAQLYVHATNRQDMPIGLFLAGTIL
jgi:hypothetical protein